MMRDIARLYVHPPHLREVTRGLALEALAELCGALAHEAEIIEQIHGLLAQLDAAREALAVARVDGTMWGERLVAAVRLYEDTHEVASLTADDTEAA